MPLSSSSSQSISICTGFLTLSLDLHTQRTMLLEALSLGNSNLIISCSGPVLYLRMPYIIEQCVIIPDSRHACPLLQRETLCLSRLFAKQMYLRMQSRARAVGTLSLQHIQKRQTYGQFLLNRGKLYLNKSESKKVLAHSKNAIQYYCCSFP